MRLLPALAVALVPTAATAAEISGTWQGTYTCNQGLTGLTLTVQPAAGNSVTAVFRFYQVDANPGVPDGCFAMSGSSYGSKVRLDAGRWLYRPWGYLMVDLAGSVSPDGADFTGSVLGPNCTSFALHRVTDDVSPKACQPSSSTVS